MFQKTTKTKKTKKQSCSGILRESLVFRFLVSGLRASRQTKSGLKLDTPEKARTRRWERCFKGVVCRRRDDHLCIYIYIYEPEAFRVYLASLVYIQYKIPS